MDKLSVDFGQAVLTYQYSLDNGRYITDKSFSSCDKKYMFESHLEVKLKSDKSTVLVGDFLIFYIILSNKGTSPIMNISLQFDFVDSFLFIENSFETEKLNTIKQSDNNKKEITIDELDKNSEIKMSFKVKVINNINIKTRNFIKAKYEVDSVTYTSNSNTVVINILNSDININTIIDTIEYKDYREINYKTLIYNKTKYILKDSKLYIEIQNDSSINNELLIINNITKSLRSDENFIYIGNLNPGVTTVSYYVRLKKGQDFISNSCFLYYVINENEERKGFKSNINQLLTKFMYIKVTNFDEQIIDDSVYLKETKYEIEYNEDNKLLKINNYNLLSLTYLDNISKKKETVSSLEEVQIEEDLPKEFVVKKLEGNTKIVNKIIDNINKEILYSIMICNEITIKKS